jgi:hypothetical protein
MVVVVICFVGATLIGVAFFHPKISRLLRDRERNGVNGKHGRVNGLKKGCVEIFPCQLNRKFS